MTTPNRILITGSRDWTDTASIRRALAVAWRQYGPDTVLVHGACQGAETIAANTWRSWGGAVDSQPANWGEYGRAAGAIRNQAMVDTHPVLCLAFLTPSSRDARHCAHHTTHAGIPTLRTYSADEPTRTPDVLTGPPKTGKTRYALHLATQATHPALYLVLNGNPASIRRHLADMFNGEIPAAAPTIAHASSRDEIRGVLMQWATQHPNGASIVIDGDTHVMHELDAIAGLINPLDVLLVWRYVRPRL